MRRFLRPLFVVLVSVSAVLSSAASQSALAAGPVVRVRLPANVVPGEATAIHLTLPAGAGAVDGRLLFPVGSMELVGVAPTGAGVGLRPVAVRGGAAFGAYDLRSIGGVVALDLVVVSATARVPVRVVVDAIASRAGRRLIVAGVTRRSMATRTRLRGLAAGRTIGGRDVAIARADWEQARLTGAVCGSSRATRRLDVDGDGCVDIVDVQAIRAAHGRPGLGTRSGDRPAAGTLRPGAASGTASDAGAIVVDSTADTPDALPGNGLCADASGRCTLRAAITESELLAGDITIDFDLPGTAPVTIDLGSRLPYITRLSGSLTIDGYSQPGSSVNTARYGSNAVPGVRLRGNGLDADEVGLYITSGGNLVRGLIFSDLARGIVIDGAKAVGNRIMGNWMGFDRHGENRPQMEIGVLINTGATDTRVGSAALADRNVIGNVVKGIDQYGPGTKRSVIQGNLLCIAPGGAAAECSVGMDHDFGPRDDLIGGDGDGERNVIGPTLWEGIELSHGWARTGDDDARWRITGNRIVGNWIGFRMDGHYDPDFRSGHLQGSSDSAGVHVWDGANDNVIARNTVASHFDGIRMRTTQAHGNQVIDNLIGVSPRGERAPLRRWGIHLEQGLTDATLRGNVIRNPLLGGVGLQDTNVTGVRISRTIVSGTAGPAIMLARQGSSGANHLLPAPRIGSARIAGGTTTVRGTARAGATVEVYRSSRAAGRAGMPAAYLGRVTVPSSGSWRLSVTGLERGQRVTALQIRSGGDTSAMSVGVAVRR